MASPGDDDDDGHNHDHDHDHAHHHHHDEHHAHHHHHDEHHAHHHHADYSHAHHHADDNHAHAPAHARPGSKKRRTQPNARGVANLTPEQLARKRANDREAQRAIRERTKKQIDRLTQRIRHLESQQPYRDLQLVLRDKEAVQAEHADIRKRVERVLGLLQPVVPVSLHDTAAASSTLDHARPWLGPGPACSNARPPLVPPDMPFDERLGLDFLLDSAQRRAVDPNLPPGNVSSSRHAQYAPDMVAHLTLPRNLPAACPLDGILLEFLQDRQNRAAEGVPTQVLVGPHYPNFTSLLFPDRAVEAHPLSNLFTDILRTFPDICGVPEQVAIVFIMYLVMRWQIEPTQENYDRLPHWVTPRASQLFTSHPAWLDHLPWPCLRDKMIAHHPFVPFDQFFIPYTTTVSLNWPYEPRDCLLPASKTSTASLSASSSLPSASSPFATHVNAASPAAPATPQTQVGTPGTSTLASHLPKDDDAWLINPAFETHLRDLNNWTLGPSFIAMYPQFAGAVKIKYGR